MSIKKTLILPLLLCAVLFCGCQESGKGRTKVWNVACLQTDTHPQTLAVKKMGEIFNKLTDGRYSFEVYPNEILGPQRETLEQVQYGIIEMAVVGNPIVSSFDEGFLTFEIPFLFKNMEHQKKFFENSPVVPQLYKDIEKHNFKIATFFTAGTRNMYSSKPIRNLSDLKGMKIRTAESETYAKMMRALGGAATPMSFGEVFTAIQSGVVDGAENNEASYNNSKHYEIAPYYSMTNHLIVPDYLIVGAKAYESLSEQDKQAFAQAAKEAAEYEFNLWQEDANRCLGEVEKGGATIVKDVDTQALREACKPLHQELCKKTKIKTVYDAVQEAA